MDDIYKFKLSFKGKLVENSVDAYDLATTIMAMSQTLSRIASIKYGCEFAENLKININAFRQGSLQSEFLLFFGQIKENAAAFLPLISDIKRLYEAGKEILACYKNYIEVKTGLKGEAPKKVTAMGDGNLQIIGDNNKVFVVTPEQFKVLQDKSISSNVAKSVSPLNKESSEISELEILIDDEPFISIDKEDAKYLESTEQLQEITKVTYKGIISKIDTKACSGFINLGNKRLPFSYNKNLNKDKFSLLVESLKTSVQIYLIGKVTMDFEGNPKKMEVADVQIDQQLF